MCLASILSTSSKAANNASIAITISSRFAASSSSAALEEGTSSRCSTSSHARRKTSLRRIPCGVCENWRSTTYQQPTNTGRVLVSPCTGGLSLFSRSREDEDVEAPTRPAEDGERFFFSSFARTAVSPPLTGDSLLLLRGDDRIAAAPTRLAGANFEYPPVLAARVPVPRLPVSDLGEAAPCDSARDVFGTCSWFVFGTCSAGAPDSCERLWPPAPATSRQNCGRHFLIKCSNVFKQRRT
mmetsp:Transcript_1702/g.3977  ORF Transcript_1702/g.3977 Transcript_1702/m.3977 type:complete len:240 (+) Transcript_1702:374-1093(+)